MIYALDKIAPGTANEDTLLYGVEVKFYNSRVRVDRNLMTAIPRLYAVGDGSGGVRSAMTEFYGGVLFIVEAGEGAHLAVVTSEDADAGLIGHNMSELVEQLGEHLTALPRTS